LLVFAGLMRFCRGELRVLAKEARGPRGECLARARQSWKRQIFQLLRARRRSVLAGKSFGSLKDEILNLTKK